MKTNQRLRINMKLKNLSIDKRFIREIRVHVKKKNRIIFNEMKELKIDL